MYKRNRTEARSPERSKERSRRFEEGPAGRGSERAGDARLGLGQFRNDNIRKVLVRALACCYGVNACSSSLLNCRELTRIVLGELVMIDDLIDPDICPV